MSSMRTLERFRKTLPGTRKRASVVSPEGRLDIPVGLEIPREQQCSRGDAFVRVVEFFSLTMPLAVRSPSGPST